MNATRLTQPLRDEHRELRPELEALRDAADAVGSAPRAALAEQVARCHTFLTEHLLVHAQAEEAALYPAVERVSGCAGLTQTMMLDHAEIGRLAGELGDLREAVSSGDLEAAQQRRLRLVLYGLYVLVMLHLQKEEDAYLPLLDARMTSDEANAMFEEMHSAAARAAQSAR